MTVGTLLATFSVGIALVLNPAPKMETETIVPANLYPSCGIVTSVTSTELEWTDFNGNIWVVVGDPEDWVVGDRIAVIMDNNGTTETIYDDITVKTKYCGWIY